MLEDLRRIANEKATEIAKSTVADIYEKLKNETADSIYSELKRLSGIAEDKIQELKGKDGYSPQKGVDYFTTQDIERVSGVVMRKLEDRIPKKNRDYFDGKDGKNGVNADPADVAQIVLSKMPVPKDGKTPTRDELMSIIRPLIEEAKNELANLTKMNIRKVKVGGGGGGGMGNFVYKAFTANGVLTQFTLDYNVASAGKAIMVLYNGQPQEYGTHYTVSGKTISFTFTPEDGLVIWAWHIRT